MADRSLTLTIFGEDKSASKALQNVGTEAESMASKIKTGAKVLGGLAVADFFRDSANAASDMIESTNAVSQTFGSATHEIEAFGESAAENLKMSNLEARDAAVTFGTFGKSAGKSGEDLADFSTEMVTLAADMASFKNTSPEQAIEAVGAALRGESEPIRSYGVLLDEATLKAQAMKMGLIETTKQALTPQQKVLAAHAVILQQTKDMQGDVARSAGTMASAQREATAKFKDVQAEIGERLVPIGTKLFELFGDVGVPALQATGQILGVVFDAVGPVVTVVGDLATVVMSLPTPLLTAVAGLGAVAAMKGPLDKAWTSIKSGAETAALSVMVAGDGAKGAARGFAIAEAGVKKLGAGMKAAFMSNPIGLALVGITTAISLFADKSDDAVASADRFTDVIDDQTGALKANAQQLAAKRLADDGSLQKAKEAGISAELYTRAVLGEAAAVSEIKRRQDEANATFAEARDRQIEAERQAASYGTVAEDVVVPNVHALNAAVDQLNKDQGDLQATQAGVALALDGAGNAAKTAGDKMGPAAKEVSGLADAFADGTVKADELKDQIGFVMLAVDKMQGRNGDAEAAQRYLNGVMRTYADTLRDVPAAERAVADAKDGVTEATKKAADIQGKATDKNYTATEKAKDLAAAARDVASAQDHLAAAQQNQGAAADKTKQNEADLREEMSRAGQQALNTAIEQGDLTHATDNATVAMGKVRQSFIDSRIAAGDSAPAAAELANKLGLIPGDYTASINANAAGAVATVDGVKTKLDVLDNKIVTVDIKAQVWAAQFQGVSDIFLADMYAGMPGKAAGGLITGGTPGRDSVPTMLMPGELVLTTAEVDRAAGPAGVYDRLRGGGDSKALRRLEQTVADLVGVVAAGAGRSPQVTVVTQASDPTAVAEEVRWRVRRVSR